MNPPTVPAASGPGESPGTQASAGHRAGTRVPLPPREAARVEAQAEGFVQALLAAGAGDASLRTQVVAALDLGQTEAAHAMREGRRLLGGAARAVLGGPALRVRLALRDTLAELGAVRAACAVDRGVTELLLRLVSARYEIEAAIAALIEARERLADDAAAIEESRLRLSAAERSLRACAHYAHHLRARLTDGVAGIHQQRAAMLARFVLPRIMRRLQAAETMQSELALAGDALSALQSTARLLVAAIGRVIHAAARVQSRCAALARHHGRRMRPGGANRDDARATPALLLPAVDAAVDAVERLDALRTEALAAMLAHPCLVEMLVAPAPASARADRGGGCARSDAGGARES